MQKAGKKIALTALFMVFVTLLAKVLGLLRDRLLAQNFGTSMDAVAYEAASRLPITWASFGVTSPGLPRRLSPFSIR